MEPLQLDVADLHQKSMDLERTNEDLKAKYDAMQKEAEKYKDMLCAQKLELAGAAEEKRLLQVQVDVYKQVEEKPKGGYSSLRMKFGARDSSSKSLLDLKAEIAMHLQHMKNDKFEAEVGVDDESTAEMTKKYETERAKSSLLQIEIDRLTLELQAGRKWEAEFESAKAKIKEIKKKKKEAKVQAREMKKEVDNLVREKTEVEEDKSLLTSELEGSKQQLQTLLVATSGSNASIDKITADYEEKMNKAEESRNQFEENIKLLREELEKKQAELEKKEIDLAASTTPHDDEKSKKRYEKDLKKALAKKEKMRGEIKELKSRVKELESTKQKFREEAQEYKLKLSDSNKAKQKNKARVLIEVKELIKDLTSRLDDKLSARIVNKELARSVEALSMCKKLIKRLVHELEVLQGAADGDEHRALRHRWWKKRGVRAEEIEDCVRFLIIEAERLTDVRDKYVHSHNRVAALSETVHKVEKDLMKWQFGLEEVQDRVTTGAGWGHAALSSRLLTCRRLLDRHYAARQQLESARSRRAVLRLTLESFVEGLCLILDEGFEGIGAKGVSELTRIRSIEGQIITVREELEDAHEDWGLSRTKHKSDLQQSHAGVMVVETLIKNYEALFEDYNDNDVPEIVIKCVDYIIDKGLKDKLLLLRDYDLPKIDQIKEFFDAGTYDVDLADCTDHRVVSELLKSYLRDTYESVFTSKLHDDWVKVDEIVDERRRLEAITGLLRKLPASSFSTLAAVIELLHEVSKHSSVNNSNRRLLARAFGPLLLRKNTSRRS